MQSRLIGLVLVIVGLLVPTAMGFPPGVFRAKTKPRILSGIPTGKYESKKFRSRTVTAISLPATLLGDGTSTSVQDIIDTATRLPFFRSTLTPGSITTAGGLSVTAPAQSTTFGGGTLNVGGTQANIPEVTANFGGGTANIGGGTASIGGVQASLGGVQATTPAVTANLAGGNVTVPSTTVTGPNATVTTPEVAVAAPEVATGSPQTAVTGSGLPATEGTPETLPTPAAETVAQPTTTTTEPAGGAAEEPEQPPTKFFQLRQSRLQIDHCSISRFALQLREDGNWDLSLRADQNPRGGLSGRATAYNPQLHLKRNEFVVTIRCYGAFRTFRRRLDQVAGKPVIAEIGPVEFLVENGRPLSLRKSSTEAPNNEKNLGKIELTKEQFELIDRIEVEFYYQ